MANYYFSPLTKPMFDGKHILADTGTVHNGNVVALGGGTSGSVVLSTGSGYGLAYDLLQNTYLPSTDELVANIGGDYCNVALGHFMALLGPDLFAEDAIPAVESKLYDNADGTLSVTAGGHTAVGKCLSHETVQHKDGAYSVARCVFDFTQIL